MALNDLLCADVPLRTYTHSLTHFSIPFSAFLLSYRSSVFFP